MINKIKLFLCILACCGSCAAQALADRYQPLVAEARAQLQASEKIAKTGNGREAAMEATRLYRDSSNAWEKLGYADIEREAFLACHSAVVDAYGMTNFARAGDRPTLVGVRKKALLENQHFCQQALDNPARAISEAKELLLK